MQGAMSKDLPYPYLMKPRGRKTFLTTSMKRLLVYLSGLLFVSILIMVLTRSNRQDELEINAAAKQAAKLASEETTAHFDATGNIISSNIVSSVDDKSDQVADSGKKKIVSKPKAMDDTQGRVRSSKRPVDADDSDERGSKELDPLLGLNEEEIDAQIEEEDSR